MSTESLNLGLGETLSGAEETTTGQTSGFRDGTESKLRQMLDEAIGLDVLTRDDNLWDAGLDSMQAISLIVQIEKKLSRTLTVATLLEAPTVKDLARVIDRPAGADPNAIVMLRASEGTLPPLFFIHLSGGDLTCYAALTAHLRDGRAVYGLTPPAGMPHPILFEDLAARHVASIRSVQARGPYCLAGYCFGGLLAFEIAQQLTASGEKVALLGLLDFPFNVFDVTSDPFRFRWDPASIWQFLRNLGNWAVDFVQMDKQSRSKMFVEKFESARNRVRRLFKTGTPSPGREITPLPGGEIGPCPEGVQPELWQAHEEAWRRYQPRPYSGTATLLRRKSLPITQCYDSTLGWSRVIPGIQVRTISGPLHGDAFKPRFVRTFARELNEVLSASIV